MYVWNYHSIIQSSLSISSSAALIPADILFQQHFPAGARVRPSMAGINDDKLWTDPGHHSPAGNIMFIRCVRRDFHIPGAISRKYGL
jgi:hypothetical protein